MGPPAAFPAAIAPSHLTGAMYLRRRESAPNPYYVQGVRRMGRRGGHYSKRRAGSIPSKRPSSRAPPMPTRSKCRPLRALNSTCGKVSACPARANQAGRRGRLKRGAVGPCTVHADCRVAPGRSGTWRAWGARARRRERGRKPAITPFLVAGPSLSETKSTYY
jgi:hypothetical protein